MSLTPRNLYRFDEFLMDVNVRALTRHGAPVSLSPKTFQVLTYLVLNPGRVISKQELIEAVWPESFVDENNLTQHISWLRRALADRSGCIVTISGQGYRFAAAVQPITDAGMAKRPLDFRMPKVREATNLSLVEPSAGAGHTANQTTSANETNEANEANEEPGADAVPVAGSPQAEAEAWSEAGKPALAPSLGFPKQQLRIPWRRLAVWTAATAAVGLLATGAYHFVARRQAPLFAHFTIEQATESEQALDTAISPDGLYLASVILGPQGSESLWVRHLPTGSQQPILQDPAFHYLDVTFSPNGNFIYFRVIRAGDNAPRAYRGDAYRIPILGGQPARILENVDAPVSFVAGGQRVCFYRENDAAHFMFLSAAADGGDEQTLIVEERPYPSRAACAPDGKGAAVEDQDGNIEFLNFATKSKRMLLSTASSRAWWYDLTWDQDGSGIFGIRYTKADLRRQIAFIPYPGGDFRPITNDLSEYQGEVSLTADAKTVAATQMVRETRLVEVSLKGPPRLQEHQVEGLFWFTPLHGDSVLTTDQHSVARVVDLASDHAATLHTSTEHFFVQPSLCGPGTLVVTGKGPDDRHSISRMNLDGSGVTQLTPGPIDLFPECTHDGKWLFYWENRSAKDAFLMRLALPPGKPQKVAPGNWFNLSPDGKLLATTSYDDSRRLRVLSTETLQEVHSFPLPTQASPWVAFSADNRSVFYVSQIGALRDDHRAPAATAAAIWRQPLNGSPPVLVVRLPGKFIYWIRALPDRGTLGITAMTVQYQAVLLRGIP